MYHNSGFSWHMAHMLPYFGSVHITSSDCKEDLLSLLLPRLYRFSLSRLMLSTCVPTVLGTHSTGISTCYPSTTSFDLALGPDLPREDQLYSGNLGYSAGRILTFLSLLIPAFSLLIPPLLLTGTASSVLRMLLYHSHCESTASVSCFSPGHFRRRNSRLVSCYALFECMAASEPTS